MPRPGFEPKSAELHQTGTFQGRSTDMSYTSLLVTFKGE